MGRLNNYVTLKLPFLTHLPPPSHFVTFVHENPLALSHAQHKHPLPFPIKNEILGFKKDRSRNREIYFLFHVFFFVELCTNNTKKIQIKALESETKALSRLRWTVTNKSYKTCYFGLRIPYM